MIVKKYGNRRLYDTEASRYITIGELTERIQRGAEVTVLDAKTGADLTTVTLTQIIVDNRGGGRMLPAALLHQLIRLGDDALADFFGQYMTAALQLYLQAKQLTPMNPFAAFNPFAGGLMQALTGRGKAPKASSDIELLRREVDELKRSIGKRKR